MNKVLLVIVVAVLVVAGVIGYLKFARNNSSPTAYAPATYNPPAASNSNSSGTSSGAATGNPDSIINAAINQSTQTDSLVKQSDSETQSTNTDVQTITNFSGVYNANEVQ